MSTCPSIAKQRWIDTLDDYLDATVREAQNREQGTVLGLKDYIDLRRGNSGVYPTFALIECILELNLEPEVFDHPALSNLTRLAGDLVMISNVSLPVMHLGERELTITKDMYSYNKEQAAGHSANNFITVVMAERGVGLQEAFNFAGGYFENQVKEFLEWKANMPSWGPKIDDAVSQYVSGLECWVAGNMEWSLSTHRYFGESVEEVRRTRRVALRQSVKKQNFELPFVKLLPFLVAFSATCYLLPNLPQLYVRLSY